MCEIGLIREKIEIDPCAAAEVTGLTVVTARNFFRPTKTTAFWTSTPAHTPHRQNIPQTTIIKTILLSNCQNDTKQCADAVLPSCRYVRSSMLCRSTPLI